MKTNRLLTYQYERLAAKDVGRKMSIFAEIYHIFTNLFRISKFKGSEIGSENSIYAEKLRIGMYFFEYKADRGGKRIFTGISRVYY